MVEVKEILPLWLDGRSLREVTRLAAADRKTVRRYVEAAQTAGLDRDAGAEVCQKAPGAAGAPTAPPHSVPC